jgi:hypothetical protein
MSGQRLLYCEPGNLALTSGQDQDILLRFVKDHPEIAEVKVGTVFLLALQATFPCPK